MPQGESVQTAKLAGRRRKKKLQPRRDVHGASNETVLDLKKKKKGRKRFSTKRSGMP